MRKTLDLALIQMESAADRSVNVATIERLLDECTGCDLAVVPENSLCQGREKTMRDAARTLDSLTTELGGIAARHGIHVLFGGVPVIHGNGVRNAALGYDPTGALVARYDKMHLFQLDPDRPGGVDETRVYSHGTQPIVWELHGWRICLSICYDIRFPELFRACVPVDLILCPMAFTARTGRDHGQLLLRARAVENQCYVGSASLCGKNEETGMDLFGHSMVVDPWGEVVMDGGEREEGIFCIQCEREKIRAVRETLPALRNMKKSFRR